MGCVAVCQREMNPLVSRNSARERLRDALRLYVGRGRRYSVKELSNATGVADRMTESAMCTIDDPDYRPLTLENLLSISKFLGAPFLSAFLEPAGLGAFELMDGQPPLPRVLATAEPEEPDAIDLIERGVAKLRKERA